MARTGEVWLRSRVVVSGLPMEELDDVQVKNVILIGLEGGAIAGDDAECTCQSFRPSRYVLI